MMPTPLPHGKRPPFVEDSHSEWCLTRRTGQLNPPRRLRRRSRSFFGGGTRLTSLGDGSTDVPRDDLLYSGSGLIVKCCREMEQVSVRLTKNRYSDDR
jgi:hypothetical protein